MNIFKKIFRYSSFIRMSLLSLIIALLFYLPFMFVVLENDIERETSREIFQTDKIVSEVKDILMQDNVHNREEESIRIGSVLPRYRIYTNDSLTVIANEDEILFKEVSRVPSYIDLKVIEVMANAVAKKEKNRYESGLLTPTSMNVDKEDGHHYIYKLVYHIDHEDHRDKIIFERDLTELYAKPIHNTLTYGGLTFVFLYIAIIGISYLMQIWKLREIERVIEEQQRILANSSSGKYTNVGREYNKFLEKVSGIMINLHNRSQEVYTTNKNLLQDISHETRSRLTEIKHSVDLLRYYGTEDAEQVEQFLSKIETATLNIATIQDTFIDLAKVENYESIGVSSVYNVQELINFAIDQASIRYKNIDFIQVDIRPNKYFRIQREHFLLVMRTLLDNAVKYSNESNKVRVEILDDPKYNNCIAIKITNWGTYIPEDERERIFERYYRAKNVRQSKHGVGLGLHMVKKVMELYEGRIEVESDSFGKTSFIIIFLEALE